MKTRSLVFNKSKSLPCRKSKAIKKSSSKSTFAKVKKNNAGKKVRHMKKKLATKNLSPKMPKLLTSNNAQSEVIDNRAITKRWKTLNEREVLECYFELDPEWTRKTIVYIKDLVQLSEKQIYKWGYEKRRRSSVYQKEEKAINMKQVTNIAELDAPLDPNNYNQIVEDLFPEEVNEEESLTVEQKEIYDHVRNQLIERSLQYENQSDLDKLLNERIPIRNIALEAKANQDMPNIPIEEVKKSVSNL